MRDNFCIFKRITHSSGELEQAYLNMGSMFETLELNGPGLILEFRDTEESIRSKMKIKEYDEINVSYGDPWNEGSVNKSETFVVLTCKPSGSGVIRLNCMAKPVFQLKQQAETAKAYQQRSVSEILRDNANGAQVSCGSFAVVENYQCVVGQRPSEMLRKLAMEHGAHLWYSRGTLHMKKFSELLSGSTTETFHYGKHSEPNYIFKYEVPSKQMQAQESSIRTFAGWDEVKGRVSAALDLPIFKSAKSKPAAISPATNPYVLGNCTTAKKTAIDFLAIGKMSVVPGDVLKLVWHMADPASPVDEGLPDMVVVEAVSHWYSAQKYYIRVKGAVALEPI